jgi:hypothetical protein
MQLLGEVVCAGDSRGHRATTHLRMRNVGAMLGALIFGDKGE